MLLQILFWTSYIADLYIISNISIYGRITRINTIFQLRNFRIIEFVQELKDFQVVVQTTQNMTLPIFSKLLFLYVVFYLFAIMGGFVFGGVITQSAVKKSAPDSPPFYHLLNFNSYGASLITLFHFMVVNNWFVTVNMYVEVTGEAETPYLFFTVFWCCVVLVLLNVLIALILEVYSSVSPEVNEKFKRIDLAL